MPRLIEVFFKKYKALKILNKYITDRWMIDDKYLDRWKEGSPHRKY